MPILPMTRLATLLAAASLALPALATNYPVTPAQRDTAERVAQAGVPLSELAANAPEQHTVVRGDTLWGISSLFLKSPWRWPELWGMNREQIRNPHLIYPGQLLRLIKRDGRAYIQVGDGAGADGSTRLQPSVRATPLSENVIASIPQHLIEPFLNDAVVMDSNELASAPRIVAAPEGRVMSVQGDQAYVRGIVQPQDSYRVFRRPQALKDRKTGEILGYEAVYVGAADLTRMPSQADEAATVAVRQVRLEMGAGDRLAPMPPREFRNYVPHAPERPVDAHIVSVYGEALAAGQNQIIAINKGVDDGMERGHVLAIWRAGRTITDRTGDSAEKVRLPDEKHGVALVFQTFKRVSYALIMTVKEPVSAGDRITQP
jgi:hypothetical protein